MNKNDFIVRNRIQAAIDKHKDCFPLWIADKTDISLRPTQVIHAEELLKFPKSVTVAPPRFGKTMIVQLVGLYESAIYPFEDLRVWAPKEDQAKESIKYQIEAIQTSQILSRFIAKEQGKRKISSKGYRFKNGSNANVFGIYGNFDGQNSTSTYLEEYDDLDPDIVNNRVMPRGSATNRNGLPTRVRISGTIQAGKGNIYQAYKNPIYNVNSLFDVNVGLKLGYYDEAIIEQAKHDLTEDEYNRIWMLIFTESQNFIPEKLLRYAIGKGLKLGLEPLDPMEMTSPYQPTGYVSAALDMGSSGESKGSSKYSATFIETIGNVDILLGGKEWPATENPKIVISEFCDRFEKFGATCGMGDALKADMIRDINQVLYARRLIKTNVDLFTNHSKSTWPEWDFSPVWNTGEFKWLNGVAVQNEFKIGNVVFPYVEPNDDRENSKFIRKMASVIANIKSYKKSPTQKYPTLEAINKVLGDDQWDSLIMAKAASLLKYTPRIDLSGIQTSGQRTFERGSFRKDIDRSFHEHSKKY